MTEHMATPVDAESNTPEQGRGRRVVPVVAAVAGAALVLGVGGAFAASKLSPKAGDPEDVLPGSTFAFAKVDLDPSIAQKAAYVKFRALAARSDDGKSLDTDPQGIVCKAMFAKLDCDSQVKPWLGDRFAAAAWPGESKSKPNSAYVVKTTDADKARAAVASAYPNALVKDGYVILDASREVKSAQQLEAAVAATGRFADNKNYTSDIKALNSDGIANAWLDAQGARDVVLSNKDKLGTDVPSSLLDEDAFKGRVIAGLAITENGIQAKVASSGVEAQTDTAFLDGAGITQLDKLPKDTAAAVSVARLGELLAFGAKQDAEMNEQLTSFVKEIGLGSTKDLSRLTGTESAVGLTSFTEDASVVARMLGADTGVVKKAVALAGAPDEGSDSITVARKGDAVELSMGKVAGSDEALSSSSRYRKAMPPMKDAMMAAYIDVDAMATQVEDKDLEGGGAIGMVARYDREAKRAEVTVNWVIIN